MMIEHDPDLSDLVKRVGKGECILFLGREFTEAPRKPTVSRTPKRSAHYRRGRSRPNSSAAIQAGIKSC